MSGVITIDTGARSAVTVATGRTAGRTESAVQHDTKSPAVAARTKRAFMVGELRVRSDRVLCERSYLHRFT
jgi:hypothetical protein